MRTLETLLERDLEALERDAGLAPGVVADARAAAARRRARFRRASEASDPDDRVATGCAAVDALLRGGFRAGDVSEVEGPTASGKTQLLAAAARRPSGVECPSVLALLRPSRCEWP